MPEAYEWLWIARSTTKPEHDKCIASHELRAGDGVLPTEVGTIWPTEADAQVLFLPGVEWSFKEFLDDVLDDEPPTHFEVRSWRELYE